MNKEQDYASDSDESDEDFCVSNENKDESDEDDEEDYSESESDGEDEDAEANKKQTKAAKEKKIGKVNEKRIEAESENFTRTTRQGVQKKSVRETASREELESDEETDKSRSDALWADFLGDVGGSSKPASKPKETPLPAEKAESVDIPAPVNKEKVTEILDFAGEEVSVTKTLTPKTSVKENLEQRQIPASRLFGASKRTASNGGGLGSLLNQLGKKKKMSVLEKSQMDWKSFKHEEGIDEDLRTHNKGKHGFLERQDFLQRTDLRQFEIEKGMRQTRRQN